MESPLCCTNVLTEIDESVEQRSIRDVAFLCGGYLRFNLMKCSNVNIHPYDIASIIIKNGMVQVMAHLMGMENHILNVKKDMGY